MKKIILTCLGIFAALLAGCAKHNPIYHSAPIFNQPKTLSGKQCVQRCLEQKSRCDQRCGLDHEQCLVRQKKLAHERYVKYLNQMLVTKKKLVLKEDDFIDYAACGTSCECVKSDTNCYTLCDGAVSEQRICVQNCG
jgi:hypothetical protein